MEAAEIIIAAILLTSPPSNPDDPATKGLPSPSEAWLAALRPTLISLALDAEIIDPREASYWLVGDNYTLDCLRGNWVAMIDAPMIAEGSRFPPCELLTQQLTFNREVRAAMEARRAIDLIFADQLRAGVEDCDRRYRILDYARDAGQATYFVQVRRSSLRSLRELIGAPAFYSGDLPSPVP